MWYRLQMRRQELLISFLAEEDNSIVVVQGANALVNESVVNRSKALLIKADMVVLQLDSA